MLKWAKSMPPFSYLHQGYATTFSKLMKTYHFLLKHPKFEVEFPRDGSKPPPKHNISIRKNSLLLKDNVHVGDSNIFVRHPTRSERPAGQEHSKPVDAITVIVNKVMHKQQDQLHLLLWLKWCEAKLRRAGSYQQANEINHEQPNHGTCALSSMRNILCKSLSDNCCGSGRNDVRWQSCKPGARSERDATSASRQCSMLQIAKSLMINSPHM